MVFSLWGVHQVGTLSRKLQAEPPPKVVKVTLSKKVPLTGEELKAHEEQNRSKQEALKASVPVEETGSQLSGGSGPAPAVTVEPVKASEGNRGLRCSWL